MAKESHGDDRPEPRADAARAEEREDRAAEAETEAKEDGTQWRDPNRVGKEPTSEGWTQDMVRDLKLRSRDRSLWMRLLFMIFSGVIFLIIYTWLVWFVVAFQFLSRLITGRINRQLLASSDLLVRYAGDLLAFLLYRTEQRPWPFNQREPQE